MVFEQDRDKTCISTFLNETASFFPAEGSLSRESAPSRCNSSDQISVFILSRMKTKRYHLAEFSSRSNHAVPYNLDHLIVKK